MNITAVTDQQRKKRNKEWNDFLEKYEKRGQLNITECYFSEVSYKLFAKSLPQKIFELNRRKRKKSKKVSVQDSTSDIYHKSDVKEKEIFETDKLDIDINVEKSFGSENRETTDSNLGQSISCSKEILKDTSGIKLIKVFDKSHNISTTAYNFNKTLECKLDNNELKKYIEIDLRSNLKLAITNKSVSKLLETDDCDYWHNCIKQEMKRLSNYIPRSVLKEYMGYCYNGGIPKYVDTNINDFIEHKMKSNLKQLFIKREFMRHKKDKYLKYRKLVQMEWQRLCSEVPVDYLLVYGYSAVCSIKKLKGGEMDSTTSI